MKTPCYCLALRAAARKATALYDEALAPAGLNLAQYGLMRRIERAGAVSLTELGRMAELDRSTVGRNVKVLERLLLVRLSPAKDQREAAVRPHARRVRGAAARRSALGGRPAPGRDRPGRRRRGAVARPGAEPVIFLAQMRVSTRKELEMTASTPSAPALHRQSAALSLSNPLAAAMAARNVYYGWVVAGATFLVMLATAGAMGAPGVIIRPLEKEFGWSAADISSALALRIALFGLMAPFSAAFINRFGVRPVVTAAVAMICLGILASLAMTEVWQLVALWGVVVGVGTGLVALVLGATVATRWFVERRGLVVGMLAASNATGQLIFLPLLAKLTEDYGWRSALGFVVAMLLLAGVVALLVLRDRPADVGLAPYGASAIEPPPKQALSLGAMMASPLRVLYEVRSSRTFWVLAATFFVCGLSTNGLIQTHWIALCGDYGVAPVARRRSARGDRRVRFRRHDPVGMALRPLRQSLAPVRLLRLERPVADRAAVHRLFRRRDFRPSPSSTASTGSRRFPRRCA